MDDLAEIPKHALQAFERLHGLHVAIHDRAHTLTPFLPAHNLRHATACCEAVKRGPAGELCYRFDLGETHAAMLGRPGGRVQICHAGFVEWVVPVHRGEALEWVLFAGQGRAERSLRPDHRQGRTAKRLLPGGVEPAGPLVDAERSGWILEALRQLAARLRWWRRDLEALTGRGGTVLAGESRSPAGGAGPEAIGRAAWIRLFVEVHHGEAITIADLAEALHLSQSRAAHVVREECAASFLELLTAARVRTATAFLTTSSLSISEVARRSGFGDVRQFHRVFRAATGSAPGRYRARHRARQGATLDGASPAPAGREP